MEKKVIIGIVVVAVLLFLVGGFFLIRKGVSSVKDQLAGGIPWAGDTSGTDSGGLVGDMASGTELLTRYPGSSMGSHSEMIVPGQVPGYHIIYLTTDSLSEVETWYDNMMGNAGYQSMGSYTQGDTKMLNYNKAGEASAMVSLTSSEDGTSIYLIYGGASE